MIIRLANQSDAHGVAVVVMTSWRAAYKGIISDEGLSSLSEPEREDTWGKRIQDKNLTTLVCEEKGTIIGFVTYRACLDEDKDGNSVGEIMAMYLLPEYWGHGFGKMLMNEVMKGLRNQGFSEVSLWVLEDNHRARRFYEHSGFMADGLKEPAVIRGTKVIKVRYVRNV